MLADGCEARVRAERPQDEEQLRKLIKSIVDARVASGQLDNTGLTLRDLATIVDSFTTSLRGMYHPRVVYPQLEAETDQTSESSSETLSETTSISVDLQADAHS
jgi:membrane-associated HD superfamily phosphohydrolase